MVLQVNLLFYSFANTEQWLLVHDEATIPGIAFENMATLP
jgi:hypothetical protein